MDVQTAIALIIVGACGVYVAWKYLRVLKNPEAGGCHCAHCPAAKDSGCSKPVCPSTANDRVATRSQRHAEA